MIFGMDDFNKDDDFYKTLPTELDDSDFKNITMHLTSVLKNINFEDTVKSGHELMMTVFNMTGLEAHKKNEQALNVVMVLISHIFAMLMFTDNREGYFEFFDQSIIYPMLEEDN